MNPAWQLHQIFSDWMKKAGVPGAARQIQNRAGIDRHVEAMECLVAIQRHLDEMDAAGLPTQRHRRAFPRWVYAVLSYPVGWQNGTNAHVIKQQPDLDGLEDLAEKLGQQLLTRDTRAQLAGSLDEVDELLAEATELPPGLSEYARRLMLHVRRCIEDYEKFGRFQLHAAVEQLWITLRAAETEANDEHRFRFRKMSDKVNRAMGDPRLGAANLLVSIGQLAAAITAIGQ